MTLFIIYDVAITARFYKAYYWQTVIEYSQETLQLTEKRI